MSMNNNDRITPANVSAYGRDSFKALAACFNMTPGQIRAIADDLGLEYGYSKNRRTWHLTGHPRVSKMFLEHLQDLVAA